MGVRGGRGRQRITRNDFVVTELDIAIRGLSLQRKALRPEAASPFDGEGAAMAQSSKESIGSKLAALEFARRLANGDIGVDEVNNFIRGATYFPQLGEDAVKVVRGEAELNPQFNNERER